MHAIKHSDATANALAGTNQTDTKHTCPTYKFQMVSKYGEHAWLRINGWQAQAAKIGGGLRLIEYCIGFMLRMGY